MAAAGAVGDEERVLARRADLGSSASSAIFIETA